MFITLVLAMFATPPDPNAVVIQPVANLYSKPSVDVNVVSQAVYSTNVAVLEKQAGWAKIRTPDGYSGWMQTSALIFSKPYAIEGRVAQVESLFSGIYRETDITTHQPLAIVPFESRLEVIAGPVGDDDRWLQVRLPDDRTAWIQSGDITFSVRKLSVAELIDWSKRFIGLPYIWGGTSTFGYDCSGFTQMLCRRRGYSLPRDSGPQADWAGMQAVDRAELQAGDLLYFGESAKKITHTGMYIGDGEFIDATAYLKPIVQISELEGHWAKLLVAARRIR
jgi:gamma-D-glutamyl-L-lysine dipeptidyl-peptidase